MQLAIRWFVNILLATCITVRVLYWQALDRFIAVHVLVFHLIGRKLGRVYFGTNTAVAFYRLVAQTNRTNGLFGPNYIFFILIFHDVKNLSS